MTPTARECMAKAASTEAAFFVHAPRGVGSGFDTRFCGFLDSGRVHSGCNGADIGCLPTY